MSFVPPTFANLGKKAKDLFKKQYDYKNEVKVISKAENTVVVESGGYHQQPKGLSGYTKVSWTDKAIGQFEVEAHSSGEYKGKLVTNKHEGVGFTVEGAPAALSVEAAYVKDAFAATAKLSHNLDKGDTNVNLGAVIGFEGISVGGNCDFNAANPSSLTDYNIGAECSQKDLVGTIVTSNKLNDITASYFQTISPRLVLGSSLCVKPDSGSRLFVTGGEYTLDKFTTFKFKGDSVGVVGTAVTHTLTNPAAKLVASAQFDTQSSNPFSPQKFGLSVSFGDF
jgi:hypothetical protein